jgi:hypothetical protein
MKALVIAKMNTTVGSRGLPDVAQNVSFVHTGVDLPGAYHAFVVTGTPAQLTAITQHANFVAGQTLTRDGDVTAWADARTAIAAGARTRINTWLTNNGKRTLTAQDSIETLLQIFDPTYEVGRDDVFDAS